MFTAVTKAGDALASQPPILVDPLEPDSPEDRALLTTRRALCRMATVAAETGARFQREADPTDPVAWMLAPRTLFGGHAALDACLQHQHFYRAIILHGLSLGHDADPKSFDLALQGPSGGDGRRLARPNRGRSGAGRSAADPLLFTATLLYSGKGVMLQAFHASVARHHAEVVQRLRKRLGDEIVGLAEIRVGFHPTIPVALALVPTSVAEVIRSVEANCADHSFHTFAVDIEQRLEA